jgi:hypothetical protein
VGHYTAACRQFHVRTEMPKRRVQRNVGVCDYGPVSTPVETARRATQLPVLFPSGGHATWNSRRLQSLTGS